MFVRKSVEVGNLDSITYKLSNICRKNYPYRLVNHYLNIIILGIVVEVTRHNMSNKCEEISIQIHNYRPLTE